MTPQEILDEAFAALGVQEASPLAQGGQKWVFKAELAGQPVVVKVVSVPEGPAGVITLERAHREVELLADVDSPFVVKVLSDAVEIGTPPAAVAWVEECLNGDDLSSHLDACWSDEETFGLISDIGQALKACHELSVVHRDLSPGNIRSLPNGRYLLMDPGYAKHLQRTAITGFFQPGTPGFRSPEHVVGGNPSAASDIFALGILAFYARTLVFPIDPTGPAVEYDRRLLNTPAVSIATVTKEIDSSLAVVIDRCLQRQPARRYLDGNELSDHLHQIGRLR